MLVCAACGYYNRDEAKVCVACGTSLASARLRTCPTCGTLNSIRDAYCIRCLTLLPPGERQLDISLSNISDADVAPDPLAALTQALPAAQVDFTAPPAQEHVPPANTQSKQPVYGGKNGRGVNDAPTQPIRGPWRSVVIAFILLLALVPLIFHPAATIGSLGQTSATGLSSLTVPRDSVVLVSFDYGPAYAAELDPLAKIVLTRLAKQRAKLLIMSTHPLGMANAEQVLSANLFPWAYGQDYVLLGYLPGEDAGLRLLLNGFSSAFQNDFRTLQPISSLPLTRDITGLSKVTRIIVLSEGAEDVQRWIEQVNSQTQIPLAALTSVIAEPQLEPYYLSGQLAVLAGGWPAALEYQALNNNGKVEWGYSLGLTAMAVLIIITTLAASIMRWTRRAKNGQ